MTALFHTISHGMHRYFSTKLQMLKLCCCFATRCQHHMSGVALVPSKADPAGILEEGRARFFEIPKTNASLQNTCPPVFSGKVCLR